jgi:hypothetical protein
MVVSQLKDDMPQLSVTDFTAQRFYKMSQRTLSDV